MKPSNPQAFKLMMEGAACFADMERRGMRIDVPYLDRMLEETGDKIREIEQLLKEDDVFTTWRRRFGRKSDLNSRDQLGKVIFEELGVECKTRTKTGRPATGAEALEDVDFPFVKRWNTLEKLKKARNTFLVGIRRETVNGFLHPFFNLHTATTYRSSSSDPNFQNQPNRDKRQAKLIRRAFIPRPGCVLVEADYGALEFKGAANFWQDPEMLAYASDPTLDIHRDMAAECFQLERDDVSKGIRHFGKNGFLFPRLYGSTAKNISINMWTMLHQTPTKTVGGVDLRTHLKNKDIRTQHEFFLHIESVESKFNRRFPKWSEDKDVWWDLYLRRGWFPLATGFVCAGVFSYNNLMNTPIQGPSFHCLLWSAIEMNKWLKRHKFKSLLIGQIHDSMFLDVYLPELQDVLNAIDRIMTEEIRKKWDWILTPLIAEVEVAEKNWFYKQPWERDNSGEWKSK